MHAEAVFSLVTYPVSSTLTPQEQAAFAQIRILMGSGTLQAALSVTAARCLEASNCLARGRRAGGGLPPQGSADVGEFGSDLLYNGEVGGIYHRDLPSGNGLSQLLRKDCPRLPPLLSSAVSRMLGAIMDLCKVLWGNGPAAPELAKEILACPGGILSAFSLLTSSSFEILGDSSNGDIEQEEQRSLLLAKSDACKRLSIAVKFLIMADDEGSAATVGGADEGPLHSADDQLFSDDGSMGVPPATAWSSCHESCLKSLMSHLKVGGFPLRATCFATYAIIEHWKECLIKVTSPVETDVGKPVPL